MQPGTGSATDAGTEDDPESRDGEIEGSFGQPDHRFRDLPGLEENGPGRPQEISGKPRDRGGQPEELEGAGHEGEAGADQGRRFRYPRLPESLGGKLSGPAAKDEGDNARDDANDEAATSPGHGGQAFTPWVASQARISAR